MTVWLSIFTVALVYLVAAVTPGPNFLITVRHAIAFSRRSGVYTALGIASGTTIHVLTGFAGLTAIIWRVDWLFDLARAAGAVYLFYLGWQALRRKTSHGPLTFQSGQALRPVRAYRAGLFTCLSNPKSALFYLSLFTAVIPPDTPPWARLVMIATMISLSITWYATVAVLFSQAAVRRGYARLERPINYLLGTLFIGLGVKLALARG